MLCYVILYHIILYHIISYCSRGVMRVGTSAWVSCGAHNHFGKLHFKHSLEAKRSSTSTGQVVVSPPSLPWASSPPALDLGQTWARPGPDLGQTWPDLGQIWARSGPDLARPGIWADMESGQTLDLGRPGAGLCFRPTYERDLEERGSAALLDQTREHSGILVSI